MLGFHLMGRENLQTSSNLLGFPPSSPATALRRSPSIVIVEMFYDLNVSWTEKEEKLQRTIAFLDECKETSTLLMDIS